MEIPIEVAKNETQSLVNWVKKEAGYLCCFNSYAQEFEGRKERLNAELDDERRRIDKARGASHVTSAALQWKGEAEKLIAGDAEKEKCFNDLCLNCWRQYRKGKDLAKRTLEIDKLLERCNVNIEDGAADLLGIKYHCIPTFMDFESRKSKFQDLKNALENEENNMIGLHGLGGAGKTTMAKQVGLEVEGSTFGKVIFVVVSKPPDFKKLRREIARKLELELKDGEEEALLERILAKIIALKEKLLIVLDDLWEEFDLNKELGIPLHHQHKGCTVLITTRNKDICPKMECQKEIHLEALISEEALSLFLKHTSNSFNLESLAPKIVKHCHGIPVVIVAVARSLKGRPPMVWKEALRNLESGDESILTVNDDLKEVYKGLKLSYDNLKHKKAKELFLISSLFPEDFEIPKESLFRIGVGMGPFGEDDDYKKRRKNAIDAIVELQDSSLLLNAEMECVKMHDLVHEVALLIRKQIIQPVVESEQPREEGWKCLFWKNNDFPKQPDGGKLEILIMFPEPSCFSNLKVPDTFFSEMTKLKVLFLQTGRFLQSSAPSLFPSIQSLQDLRTLKLVGFKSCCISMLGKLLNLETLWLDNCSINKLPEEKFKLEKLRFLRVEYCKIKMGNPFELIQACPKLEELTFFGNKYDKMENKDTISQKVSFHELDIYQISSKDLSDYFDQYGSLLSRCFQPGDSMHLISEETFKQLARTPELLILEGYEKKEHKNLIPDIVSVDDRGKTDLIILKLDFCPSMQCLIDGMNNHLYANAFSNLVELSLYQMGLSNILFDGNYNLCYLKTMTLKDCPKLTSIFLPSTARSLSLLEELTIKGCGALECILEDKSSRGEITDDDGDNDQKSYGAMFSKLKILVIESCGNLEIILPILPDGGLLKSITILNCEKLKYIFDKFQELSVMLSFDLKMKLFELPSLVGIFRECKKSISSSMQLPISTASSTKTRSLSWAQVCCFKSRATSEEANGAVSTQIFDASTDRGAPSLVARCFLVQSVKNVRKIKLVECGNITSFSTLSIAVSTIALKTLTIRECHKLKCITTHEGDAHVDKNNCSIFPTLEELEIWDCEELEILFVSSIFVGLEKLKSLTIEKVLKLTYVVGNYQKEQHSSNQNEIDELCFNLPALETLNIKNAPMMDSICSKNYKLGLSSSLDVEIWDCGIKSFTSYDKIFDASTDRGAPSLVARCFLVQSVKNVREIKLVECGNITSFSTLSIAVSTIALKTLTIHECHKLKCITTHEGDAHVDKNNCSIFPTLEELEIWDCEELEILFVSSISVGLEKLKSLTIMGVPKLTYVVGNYQKEQHSSNQNEIDELCFNLPALETLSILNAPMMDSICSKNYKLGMSSSLCVLIWECGIKSFTSYDKEVDASTNGVPPSLVARCFLVQSVKNVREIKLGECGNITSFSTLSIAVSTIALKTLTIGECHKLKCITTHEGDAHVDKNNCSIFPTLEELEIEDCEELEILFVSSISVGLEKLKSLTIRRVPRLKYVVGNYQKEQHSSNQNEIDELCFNLPALETLYIEYAPMINGICSEKYKLKLSSPLNVVINNCRIKSFTEEVHVPTIGAPLFHVTQNLSKTIREIELEECTDLISLTTLSIASTILLEVLKIKACGQLKCIVADEGDDRTQINYNSIFPKLKRLEVSDCDALEYLFPAYAEPCFPNLESISVSNCHKLKYLFPITISDILPELRTLEISEANELEHVLIKRDVMEEMFMKNVLPQLSVLKLRNLPNLVSVCHGINFQEKDYYTEVYNCPKFETSTTQYRANPEIGNSQVEEKAEEMLSSYMGEEIRQQSFTKGVTEEIVEEDFMSEIAKTTISSSDSKLTGSLVVEARAKGISSNTLYQISLTSEKEVPIHTSLSLTILPTRDNTPACAKIFEEEEEEEEEGGLITSQHLRSGIKASSSLSEEKLETSIDGVDRGDIKESDMFQNDSNSNVEPSSLTLREQELSYSKGDPFVPLSPISSKISSTLPTKPFDDGSKNQDSEVCEGTKEKLSSHLNGRQAVETQPHTTNSSNFTRGTMEGAREIVEEGIIFEKPKMTNLSSGFTGGLVTTRGHRSDIKAEISLLKENPETPIHGDPNVQYTTPILSEQTFETILPPSAISSKASTGLDQTPQAILCKPTNDDDIQVSDKSHAAAIGSVVPIPKPITQEIVEMMKLDCSKTCLLEEALKTHPQLCLSKNDRSTQMMCVSYRVVIDILNILMTRTPFTISEADKRLLEEKLKDAYLLGFDKHWLDSIKTRVFNCDVSEVDGIQETLKGLESDLKTNETMLAANRNQEVESARIVELAQKDLDAALQEHANVMANHIQLLKARQDILARQNQCWDMIAFKNKPFGF